ncbi:MAG: ABC transporter ATP-binding protein [Treponema sp.]|jgi:peptide/nickel transport system ATP-binding protein|nr:ABC transporter ATP-binding protein [Treponema sp.]
MTLLEVRNLSVGIRGGAAPLSQKQIALAIDNISFNIDAGEIAGMAGESGCGKSLTALAISRLLPAAAKIAGGTITFNGIPLHSLAEKELCQIRGNAISMIFQEPRLFLNPLMRAGAQIAETLELHGLAGKKAARSTALDTLAKLGFAEPEKIYSAFPHQLSGGMCQRVMIAIAAVCRPKLLIADEPSTALDAAAQEQILSLLKQINRDFGTAILFISHDLSVIRRFCGRFMVMYAGNIVESGPAEEIFSAAAHPYTQALIGAIPCRERRGKPLANISGRVPAITDRLPGCPFAPRCPRALKKCRTGFPPETNPGGGHTTHCFATGAAHA